MRILGRVLLLLTIALALAAPAAIAGPNDPLFINLTTDDPHRANMAITFGRNQLERHRPNLPRRPSGWHQAKRRLTSTGVGRRGGATVLICRCSNTTHQDADVPGSGRP
jgi:hypothetical protein